MTRGRWAIGSERKTGAVDVHLGLTALSPVTRGRSARVRITTHKDRHGWLSRSTAAVVELHSDPATHALTWTFEPGDETATDTDSGAWRPTALMERVSRYLEVQPEPVTRNTIEAAVKGTGKHIRQAIDFLINDGYASQEPGPRKSLLVRTIKPYREPNATVSDCVGTVSRHTDTAASASPSKGDADAVNPSASPPTFSDDVHASVGNPARAGAVAAHDIDVDVREREPLDEPLGTDSRAAR